jgi:hypothetical protein
MLERQHMNTIVESLLLHPELRTEQSLAQLTGSTQTFYPWSDME